MKFFFCRQLEDGRLSMPINPGYDTKAEAEKDATRLLRLRGARRIVLLEITDTIEIVAKVKWSKP